MSGIREAVYSRVLPIATRGLEIVAVEYSPHVALIGAAILVSQTEFGPARVEATVKRLTANGKDKADGPAKLLTGHGSTASGEKRSR